MTIYTCAFACSGTDVLLIRKARPAWQKGLLNGIGGKVEGRETIIEATVREFKEETGLWDQVIDPKIFHAMIWPGYQSHTDYPLVYFSAFRLDKQALIQAVQNTTASDEPCVIWKRDKVTPELCSCIPNLPFLVEMAEYLVLCTLEERKLRQPIVFRPETMNDAVVYGGNGIQDQ